MLLSKNLYAVYVFGTVALWSLQSCGPKGLPGLSRDEWPEAMDNKDCRQNYWDEAELVWSDEFDGTVLDTTKWHFETGVGGWGNHEWQNYRDEGNVEVSDGTLKIIAKKEGEGQHAGDYTSARLKSIRDFTYGKMEIRARIPENKGNGLWPAIWMLGSNISSAGWPACGELDIMEYVSYNPNNIHFSIHSRAHNHKDGTQITSGPVFLQTAEEKFHTYGLLWTDTYLKFYLDDPENVQLSFLRPIAYNNSNWPFSKPFYFLLNMAVGAIGEEQTAWMTAFSLLLSKLITCVYIR